VKTLKGKTMEREREREDSAIIQEKL